MLAVTGVSGISAAEIGLVLTYTSASQLIISDNCLADLFG